MNPECSNKIGLKVWLDLNSRSPTVQSVSDFGTIRSPVNWVVFRGSLVSGVWVCWRIKDVTRDSDKLP